MSNPTTIPAMTDDKSILLSIGSVFGLIMILGAIGMLANAFLNGGQEGWMATTSWVLFGLGGSGVGGFAIAYVD